MLIHECRLRRPAFNVAAGASPLFRATANSVCSPARDVEDPSFPRAERGHGGLARGRFVLSTPSTSGQGGRASDEPLTLRTLAFPVADLPTLVGAAELLEPPLPQRG